MLSNNRRFKADDSTGGDLYDSTQGDEHGGHYGQYLFHNSEPKEHLYNAQNLFADLNK